MSAYAPCGLFQSVRQNPMSIPDSLSPPELPRELPPVTGDSTGGIIPYKNPHALTSYYLGVFSIIPMLGFILGCIAVPLGISGLRKKKRHPIIRGTVHAWIGIVAGGCSVLVHVALVTLMIVAIAKG
jgi:hypothetical protein